MKIKTIRTILVLAAIHFCLGLLIIIAVIFFVPDSGDSLAAVQYSIVSRYWFPIGYFVVGYKPYLHIVRGHPYLQMALLLCDSLLWGVILSPIWIVFAR